MYTKSVLISIRPKWCEKIVNGKKTIEIRKCSPKLYLPFKCYIYCTLPPQEELFTHGCIREYANELIRLQSGKVVYSYGMQLACDSQNRPYSRDNFLCQKVIGEFTCDYIVPLFNVCYDDWSRLLGSTHEYHKNIVQMACLTEKDLKVYSKGKNCFGWHISNFILYDTPKSLNEFGMFRPPQSWCYVY